MTRPSTHPARQRPSHVVDLPDELFERGRSLVGRSRDVWLAGLGAVSALEEDGAGAFDTLVKRGKRVEARGWKRLEAARGRLGERMDAGERQVGARMDEAAHLVVGRMLEIFGVPTRDEILSLTQRVDALSSKVTALTERLAHRA